MVFNSFRVALRRLWRSKFYSVINVLGLALGLGSFILIMMYIVDELKYDQYHQHANRIYRVINTADFGGVGERSTSSPCPLQPAMQQENSGLIENSVRVYNNWNTTFFIQYEEKAFRENRFFFADSTIFNIFDIPFIQGDSIHALDAPFTVVITRSAAKRYFGEDNPVGKMLVVDERRNFNITGVIDDAPAHTHFHYDFIASMSSLRMMYRNGMPKTWYWNPFWTYVKLRPEVKPQTLEKQFPHFVEKYFTLASGESKQLHLQPITSIHLHSHLDYEIEPNGKMIYLVVLSIIALFMLLIAIINFTNLATATSAGRAREIGIRKVLGAQRHQLMWQFMMEALILSTVALLLAITLIEFILPWFNDLTGKQMVLRHFLQPLNLMIIVVIGLVTGLLSGLYPAFYLSGFQSAGMLLRKIKNRVKSGGARKVLVVVQFSISCGLIAATIIAYQQLEFLREADLGFNKENVLVIPAGNTPVAAKYDAFEKELRSIAGVMFVTSCGYIPGVDHNAHEFRPEGYPADEWQFYPALAVRPDFLRLLEVPVIAGRDYERNMKSDPDEAILINEDMVKHLGWKSPQDALGKKFNSLSGHEKVVGVYRNFNVKSMHSAISPFVLNLKEDVRQKYAFTKYILVRYEAGGLNSVLPKIESVWEAFARGRGFEYSFLADELEGMYKEENNLGALSRILSILILVVATLGLYGLASFLAEQRTRELGIRKVVGASMWDALLLLSGEFLSLVGLAAAIGLSLAWWALQQWLNSFAFAVPLNWWPFVFTLVFVMVLTLLITGLKTWQVFRKSPSVTLKYE